jgi:hypothetical protein
MRTLQEIRSATGLLSEEMIVGATETQVHRGVLASYLSNLWRGSDVVRDLIVADIRSALYLGVQERAADLLLYSDSFSERKLVARSGFVDSIREHDSRRLPFSIATRGAARPAAERTQ